MSVLLCDSSVPIKTYLCMIYICLIESEYTDRKCFLGLIGAFSINAVGLLGQLVEGKNCLIKVHSDYLKNDTLS